MDERNYRLDVALVSELECDSRERIDKASANWAPAQVAGNGSACSKEPVDLRLYNHSRPAGRAYLSLVNGLIRLDPRSEGVFVLLQDLEDLGLVHRLEQHNSTVYGGMDDLSN